MGRKEDQMYRCKCGKSLAKIKKALTICKSCYTEINIKVKGNK